MFKIKQQKSPPLQVDWAEMAEPTKLMELSHGAGHGTHLSYNAECLPQTSATSEQPISAVASFPF